MTETNVPHPDHLPTSDAPASAPAAPAGPAPGDAFSAFDMKSYEMPDMVREFAEKSVTQAREAYEHVKTAAEEATDMMEDTYETARKGFVDMNLKMIDHAQANTDRAFAFMKEMMGVKSMSEAIELQTKFAREQFEHMASQAKDMQEAATQIASESSGPMREAFERTTEKFRTA